MDITPNVRSCCGSLGSVLLARASAWAACSDVRTLPAVRTKWKADILDKDFVPFPTRMLRCLNQVFVGETAMEQLMVVLAVVDHRRPNVPRQATREYPAILAGMPVERFNGILCRACFGDPRDLVGKYMQEVDGPTPEQEKLLADQLQFWLKVGRSTEPLDRSAATDAICALYQELGKPRPLVLFFSSPAICILAWAALGGYCVNEPRNRLGRWGRLRRLVELVDFPLSAQFSVWQQFGRAPSFGQTWRLWGQLWDQLGWELLADFTDRLRDEVTGQLLALRAEHRKQMEQELASQCTEQLNKQLAGVLRTVREFHEFRSHVKDRLEEDFVDLWYDAAWSCYPAPFAGFAGTWTCGREVLDLEQIGIIYGPRLRVLLQLWIDESRSCHCWFPYDGIVLASDRPHVLRIDEGGRLHSAQGPALEYSDGYALYAWHGLCVESRLITDPITVSVIERQHNAEIRRIMIERYGWTRYIADCGAQVVDQVADDHPILGLRGARLLRKDLDGEPEPIVYLEMINSSAEPGGSRKRYLQRIDPNAYDGDAGRLCWAAMASLWHYRDDDGRLVRTFSRWQDYQPTAES